MIAIIQEKQQLFGLATVLLLIVIVLWVLQYVLIHYGKRVLALLSRGDLWLIKADEIRSVLRKAQ